MSFRGPRSTSGIRIQDSLSSLLGSSYINPNITNAGRTSIYAFANGEGGGNANFNSVSASTITTQSMNAGELFSLTGGFSTITATNALNTSNIVATGSINLDGNILTTDAGGGGELLLNGVPIATTSNISSVTEWSYYPAISSINCATNNLLNVGDIIGKSGDMSLSNVGTITFDTLGQGAIVNLSTINGVSWSNGGGGGGGSNVSTISGIVTYDTADGGLGGDIAVANITAGNGLYGQINMTANAGVGGNSSGKVAITANGGSGASGLFGQVDIIANQGSASGIITGGKINITANTGLSGGVPSAVNINAGGITVQSGFTVPVGSVGGYTFIGGNSGVNICGGSPSVIPNVPGTTYIYGTTGVEVASDMYANNIFPYQYGILNGPDLVISGREYNIGLGNHIAYANIAKAKSISFGGSTDIGNIGQITGLSTINGDPYVPGGGVTDRISNAGGAVIVGNVGQITIQPPSGQPTIINGGITITDNNISGINSLEFNTTGPPSGQITNLSTINGVAYAPGGGVTSFNTLTGAITLQAGTNISLSPVGNVITINQINQAITNRASSTTPVAITATTSGTAQTIGNLSMLTTAIYDLDIFACVVFTTNTNTIVDINCFITIDGTPVGQTFSSSINGIGHFLTFPVQCSLLSASASTHTVLLKCYASTGTNVTMNSYQLTGIGNLA